MSESQHTALATAATMVDELIANDYLHDCGELLTELSDHLHTSLKETAPKPFVGSGNVTIIEIPGTPVPKQRPRLVSGRVFTPSKTHAAEELIAWKARAAGVRISTDVVSVTVGFYFTGQRRGDIDNLVKTVLDALNGVAYVDDRQVLHLQAAVVLGASEAKTVIEVNT